MISIPKHYDVVLFITEDSFSQKTQARLSTFRKLSSIYSSHYRFHCLVFTDNPDIVAFFKQSSCSVVQGFKRNPYGMPIITSLFSIAGNQFSAKYYGYTNSDILVDPALFNVLRFLNAKAQSGEVQSAQELACRVSPMDVHSFPFLNDSMESVSSFFGTASQRRRRLRHPNSAVLVVV